MVFALDLPPKLILPEKPAIIRPADPGLIAASLFPMPFLSVKAGIGPVPTFVALGAAGTNSGTSGSRICTVPLPSGWQQNDILVIIYCAYRSSGSSAISASGYADPGTNYDGNSSGNHTYEGVLWKRATSSESSAVLAVPNTSESQAYMFAIRGCRTTGSPFNAVSAFTTIAGSASMTITTSLTTTVNNCLVMDAEFIRGGSNTQIFSFASWANASLTGETELYDFMAIVSATAQFSAAAGTKATAGSVGSTTVSQTFGGTAAGYAAPQFLKLAFGPTGW